MNENAPIADMTIRELDVKLERMRDDLRVELRAYVDERFVTRVDFETGLTRLSLDVVTRVSATLQAMVHDAMQEAMREAIHIYTTSVEFSSRFNVLLDERKELDRQERVEDFKRALKGVYWILGFLIALGQVLGLIILYLNVR